MISECKNLLCVLYHRTKIFRLHEKNQEHYSDILINYYARICHKAIKGILKR